MTITRTRLTDRVLSLSKADQTEVLVAEKDSRLTRFANSEIHQNVSEEDTEIRVRVVVGSRVGVAATNDLSDAALSAVVEKASMLARYAPELPHFPSLPAPLPIPSLSDAFAAGTAASTPVQRAEVAGTICRMATEAGLLAFGAFETSRGRLTVANSLGVFATQEATQADMTMVLMGSDSSGYASWSGVDAAEIEGEALARIAIEKALRGAGPSEIEPGAYTVLLEEDAAADLIEHVSYAGFGGQAYGQGSSFMASRLGDRLFGENVTLWDDPLEPDMLPVAFDAEGVPKARLAIVENGIARAVAHDTFTASRAGMKSTGHAFPAPNPAGPYPTRLRMAAGDQSKAELLKGIERGIWVTRFHYTNLADPHTATITGMTRDGTFLIENGEIVRPLKNLRFTTGGLDALRSVRGISRETKLSPGWFGATRAPALVIDGFRFSGVTRF